MGINPTGAVAVPLTVYGSWVTEVPANAVPENISPDCADIVFAPGSVGSRPALQRVLGSPFPAGGPNNLIPTIMAEFSFKLPTGMIQNLYFDSNGVLWVEYLSITPGAYTKIFQSTPGSFCRFMSSFGRCYIAISDGLHGADIPLQWDGKNLDRYTNDAPGAPPTVSSLTLPASTMALTSTIPAQTIATIVTSDPVTQYEGPILGFVTFYTTITITLVGGSTMPVLGQQFAIAGGTNPNFDGNFFVVTAITGPLTLKSNFYSATLQSGTGGTITPNTGSSMIRSNNQVSVSTATPHGLKVGYQTQITAVPAAIIGTSITSIVINNEDNPGIATVTTQTAHGLVPQNEVTITGVTPKMIGATGSWAAVYNGDTVTLTYSGGAHGLIPGSVVQVTDVAADVFQTTVTVASVPAPNQIAYTQINLSATLPLSNAAVSVSITWPIPDNTPDPTYFEVQACPTPTTFQVQVTYTDGTWTSGSVGFAWDGTFFVNGVLSPTSFTYLQYGPNATTTAMGTVTPFGQCAPGLHLVAVCFLDRQGGVTAPSPFTTFISNGGQYVNLANIPTGPSTTVARILVFTGAQPNVPGELPPFFYIPTIPQLEGQIVGTATQINDNTTTSAILDFSDNTLYAAIGISIPGNNLANQITLEGSLGFGAYLSRLTTWGQRNTVDNLLNMHFGGGTSALSRVLGWTIPANSTSGALVGTSWAVTANSGDTPGTDGLLQQSAFLDAYGDPILTGNTQYKMRTKIFGISGTAANLSLVFKISSVSTGFSTTATISGSSLSVWQASNFAYLEATFTMKTPLAIPNDMLFSFYALSASGTVTFQTNEWSLIFSDTPYRDQISYASYINNPSAIDGDTSQFGADDPSKLMDMGVLRGTLTLLTQAPTGRLHETDGSATNEPSGWAVDEVAANCGTLSAFGLTHSQADDEAASGGDEWMAWPSEGGAEIFGGGQPEKISQEIQPNWYDPSRIDTSVQINMAAATSIWGVNDPVQRLLMFGVPIGTATAPSKVYVLNYRNLGSAQAIAGSPPFHPSFAGKLIATDNSRKWAPWNMPINCAARMYRTPGVLSLILGGGNGQTGGAAAGFGNVYSLNPAKLTDDDYGQIFPYYTTYFFCDPEKAAALGLKGQRILMAYIMAYIQGTGQVTATYYADDLANPWSLTTTRTLTAGYFDREFGGGMCTANRIAIKLASSPITGTDNGFVVSRVSAFVKDAKLIVGGRNA